MGGGAVVGVVLTVVCAGLVSSVAQAATQSLAPSDAVAGKPVATTPRVLVAKKSAKGTLKVKVTGSGTYTVKAKGFRKTAHASKAFKVKPGIYRVKAPAAKVAPRKVQVRKGKTARVRVMFHVRPRPTPTPTENAIASPIDATYKDRFGWSWHLTVTELPLLTASTNISYSPPGSARVMWALTGGIEATLENVDAGRTPPTWVIDDAQMQVYYLYGQGPENGSTIASDRTNYPVCQYGPGEVKCWAGQIYPDEYPFDREVDLGTTSSEDVTEAEASQAAAAFSKDALAKIRFRGIGCSLEVTLSTGAVAVTDDYSVGSPDCQLM